MFTDNNPFTYILTIAKLDAMGHRWVASLGPYHFNLHYKPGKLNSNSDAFHGDSVVPTLHAELFFVLVYMWFPGYHMASMWKPCGVHI